MHSPAPKSVAGNIVIHFMGIRLKNRISEGYNVAPFHPIDLKFGMYTRHLTEGQDSREIEKERKRERGDLSDLLTIPLTFPVATRCADSYSVTLYVYRTTYSGFYVLI